MIPRCLAVAVVCLFLPLAARAASDSVTVGTVTASGTSADVPVYIRDVSGTSLGMDQPAGSKIQSFSIKVTYAPASAVQSVTFSRAGITSSLTPTSEFKPSTANSVSLLDTFQESTNLIPFTLNASAPGNLVAHLVFTLAPGLAPGTSILLTLDSSLTQLTDSGGTAATKETSTNGGLTLNNGQINIPAISVTLSPSSKTIAPASSANLSALLSSTAQSDTTVNLSSNNTSVATVPSSVVVPAGASFASFKVTTLVVGSAKITATLGSSTSNATITVAEVQEQCTKPSPPQLSAPTTVQAGTSYNVTWSAVSSATEYSIEESTSSTFTNPTTQTVTGTSVSYTHTTGGISYFYRARARNHAGNCDLFSEYSTTATVAISDIPVPPAPESRVLAVVGSLQGNFGSFFRTSLQLYNPQSVDVFGKLVFHTAGVSGSASDPSFPYVLPPGKTLAFADILPAMGLPGGLGSIDMIGEGTSPLPIALARVFNDAGTLGTTGLSEEALAPADVLHDASGVLLAPADVQKFRLNIGVRTLAQGATIEITVRDKDGNVVKTTTKNYEPTFFTQISSAAMLDGYALAGGETITFHITAGSAFIYGATTDNTTNDPSVQFARRIE